MDGDTFYWTVSNTELSATGDGKCQLVAMENNVIVKSAIFDTLIFDALDGGGTPPEPWESWEQAFNEMAQRAEDAANDAEAAQQAIEDMGAAATALPYGVNPTVSKSVNPMTGAVTLTFGIPGGAPGQPGEPGPAGDDGVSPTVSIMDIANGHRVIITDATGIHSFDVLDGANGAPGVSPEITVTNITGGHRVTIVDAHSTQTFDVMDGVDGFSPYASVVQTDTGATISVTDKNGTTMADIANGQNGTDGDNGVTFTPTVSAEGIISWTNDGGLPNPQSVNIKGPQGEPGSGADLHICSSGEYDPVTRVPTIQNPEENTFYLVPSADSSTHDMFVEWIYTNNAWEMFGSASVDLDGYQTKITATGLLKGDGDGGIASAVAGTDYGTYSKPVSGIPKTDMASDVQTSLGKADTALQTAPVTSVNNKTGAVTLNASDVGAGTYSKPSGGIPSTDMSSEVQTSLGKADTALQTAPVTSVNTKTGAVVLTPSDIGAGTYSKPSGGIPKTDLASGVQSSLDAADTAYQKPSGGIPASDLASGVIPNVPVQDVQVNGTSVLSDGVANVPIATNDVFGTVKTSGVINFDSNNRLKFTGASDAQIKAENTSFPILPQRQHTATFYGLAKAAGADMKDISSTTVGVHPEAQKSAIKSMLGAAGSFVKAVDLTLTDDVTHGNQVICSLPEKTTHVFTIVDIKAASSGTTSLMVELYNSDGIRFHLETFGGNISTTEKFMLLEYVLVDDYIITSYNTDNSSSQMRRRFTVIDTSRLHDMIDQIRFSPYNDSSYIPTDSKFVIFAC